MEATGARIDMPKKDSGSTKVQITGSADAVKKAEGAINSLISKGYSSFTHPGWVHDDILVDEKHIGAVIGKGGEYIKTIQAKTNTRINTPDKDEVGGKVIIVGKKEDVRAARLAIKELMADGYSPLTHEGFIKKEIQFPADKLHLLIGAKGQTIKSIQGNTKTKINIPERTTRTSNTAPLTVTVVGEPAGVTQAEKEILRLLIPPQIIQEDPEEEYVNGTWSESGPTEDELWD
jgi:rRNA processing protein Krr1/Pno1